MIGQALFLLWGFSRKILEHVLGFFFVLWNKHDIKSKGLCTIFLGNLGKLWGIDPLHSKRREPKKYYTLFFRCQFPQTLFLDLSESKWYSFLILFFYPSGRTVLVSTEGTERNSTQFHRAFKGGKRYSSTRWGGVQTRKRGLWDLTSLVKRSMGIGSWCCVCCTWFPRGLSEWRSHLCTGSYSIVLLPVSLGCLQDIFQMT